MERVRKFHQVIIYQNELSLVTNTWNNAKDIQVIQIGSIFNYLKNCWN